MLEHGEQNAAVAAEADELKGQLQTLRGVAGAKEKLIGLADAPLHGGDTAEALQARMAEPGEEAWAGWLARAHGGGLTPRVALRPQAKLGETVM